MVELALSTSRFNNIKIGSPQLVFEFVNYLKVGVKSRPCSAYAESVVSPVSPVEIHHVAARVHASGAFPRPRLAAFRPFVSPGEAAGEGVSCSARCGKSART